MNNMAIYELLLDNVQDTKLEEVMIGRTWTYCMSEQKLGIAMSPEIADRTIPWSGTLRGKSVKDMANWITSWNPFEASVAMASINASINNSSEVTHELSNTTEIMRSSSNANLSVFDYFLPRIINKKVVVIGRYPGLDQYSDLFDMTVLERQPGKNDLPDTACEYMIADADWVFLTATTIINKTFPRLAELAKNTNLVLMGPTVPWLPELSDFGVDFLAGVEILDPQHLKQVIAEGGGVRIFDEAIRYRIMDLGAQEMLWHQTAISDLISRRESLKLEMENWYRAGQSGFPKKLELLTIDRELSKLDSEYKRLWDARNQKGYDHKRNVQ